MIRSGAVGFDDLTSALKAPGEETRLRMHLLGETIRGTYVEYISLPVRQLYKLPNDFDPHQAAAAALVYQTA